MVMRIGDIVYVTQSFSKIIYTARVDAALNTPCARCMGFWTYDPVAASQSVFDPSNTHVCPRDVFLSLEEAELFIAMYVIDPVIFPEWWRRP